MDTGPRLSGQEIPSFWNVLSHSWPSVGAYSLQIKGGRAPGARIGTPRKSARTTRRDCHFGGYLRTVQLRAIVVVSERPSAKL
jgi:hypothetical protein